MTARRLKPRKDWAADYEIRVGKDGKPGIYLRDYGVRLAIFNANTYYLQRRLSRIFDNAAERKRRTT